MKRLFAILMGFVALSATAETVRISGVGLSAPLMQRLAEMYQRQHPGDVVNVIQPPLGSDGALRALRAGALELAVIGRPLKPDETPNFGRVREVGRTALGFATRDGAQTAPLTPRDIAAIYAGGPHHQPRSECGHGCRFQAAWSGGGTQ
jgi:phosphate transport system substrate-binding protein